MNKVRKLSDVVAFTKTNTHSLAHCPRCNRPNLGPFIIGGTCCWCSFSHRNRVIQDESLIEQISKYRIKDAK